MRMSHIPLGYRIQNSVAETDEINTEKVRKLYQCYLETGSMNAAAAMAGIDKTHSSIGKILRNRIYLGTEFYPKIIDEALFCEVQIKIKEKYELMKRKNKPEKTINWKIRFSVEKIKMKFENPYEQAEYAYSQILEERYEG